MIHPFLEVGGLVFWIITAIIALIAVSEIQSEKVSATTLTVLAYIAAFVLLTNGWPVILGYVQAHPMNILYGFGAYILIGAVWATLKWRLFFLPAIFEEYDDVRRDFLKQRGLKEMPADDKVRQEFTTYAQHKGVYIQHNRMVSNNKGRITTWLGYWPFSLVGTFLGDFLTRLFKSIFNMIAGLLQRLSDRMASKYSELDS